MRCDRMMDAEMIFVSPQGLALNSRRLLSLVMLDRQVGLAGHPHPEAHVLRETSKQSG